MGVFYTTFVVKGHKDMWKEEFAHDKESIQLRSWLILEVFLFFTWICASIFFLLFAYLFKLTSVAKNEAIQGKDDNVWNDRGSDDFLRYLKFEYFIFTFCWCKLFMEMSIGYLRVKLDDVS
jgi:cytochrome b subunit of formate dehydrogenase